MAAITQTESTGNSAVRRTRRRSSVTIDMTPMVDLAFLLLTFFVLTTSLNKAYVIKLAMPAQSNDNPTMSEKRVITLLLGKNNNLYWYQGATPMLNETTYGKLRKLLIAQKAAIPNIVVFVKATDKSHYQNVVDVLDEFAITGIDTYFIVDITKDDNSLIASREER